MLSAEHLQTFLTNELLAEALEVMLGFAEYTFLNRLCDNNSVVLCFESDLVSAFKVELKTEILRNYNSPETVDLSDDFFCLHNGVSFRDNEYLRGKE